MKEAARERIRPSEQVTSSEGVRKVENFTSQSLQRKFVLRLSMCLVEYNRCERTNEVGMTQAIWTQSQVGRVTDITARLFPTSSRGYSDQKFPMTAEANVTVIFQDDKEEELGKRDHLALLSSLQRLGSKSLCKSCTGTLERRKWLGKRSMDLPIANCAWPTSLHSSL